MLSRQNSMVVIALVFLSAFGGTSPDCASDEAKTAVLKIVREQPSIDLTSRAADNYTGGHSGILALDEHASNSLRYAISEIRLQSRDQDTGAVVCAAELSAQVENAAPATADILYKVELTSDGKLYVTVQLPR